MLSSLPETTSRSSGGSGSRERGAPQGFTGSERYRTLSDRRHGAAGNPPTGPLSPVKHRRSEFYCPDELALETFAPPEREEPET